MLDRWQSKEIIEADERRREVEKNGVPESVDTLREEQPIKVGFKDKFAMLISGFMVVGLPILLILLALVGILLLISGAL